MHPQSPPPRWVFHVATPNDAKLAFSLGAGAIF